MVLGRSGKVLYVKVGGKQGDETGEFGFVNTTDGLYILWWSIIFPDEMTSTDRLKYSMWVSLLENAMENNYDIEFAVDTNFSSKIVTILLKTP